jgi:hypothetical protein
MTKYEHQQSSHTQAQGLKQFFASVNDFDGRKFVGRTQEIARLTDVLTSDDRAAAICGIYGMYGVGNALSHTFW